MRQPFAFQHIAGGNEIEGIESKLRVLASTGGPFARAFAGQTHPNANERFDPNFLGGPNGLLQFFQLFNHADDLFVAFTPQKRDPNKSRILVAIANDQALRVLVHGQGRDQLRFAARLQAKVKHLAGIDDLLDHLAQLIDFDRKNAAVFSAVVKFCDCVFESAVNGFNAVAEQVLKADDKRKGEPARARFINNFKNGDGAAIFLERLGHDVAISIDGKVTSSPTLDVVGGVCRLQVPIVFRHFVSGCKTDNYLSGGTCKVDSKKPAAGSLAVSAWRGDLGSAGCQPAIVGQLADDVVFGKAAKHRR